MRIVLTHPYCWPYVRRGTERHLDCLARYLTSRGHDVVTISSRPGRGTVEMTSGGTRVLHSQMWTPAMSRLRVDPTHTFFLTTLRSVRHLSADVVHSFYFTDSLAAMLAGRWRGYRTILQINGIPVPEAFHRLPPDRWVVKRAIESCDRLIVCSGFVSRLVRERYGVDSQVVLVPVDGELFVPGNGPLDGRPTILSVGDFDVRRKGIRVLARAFRLVKERLPSAKLRLCGRMSPRVRTEAFQALGESGSDVEVLGLDADLPRLYREASVMVLPSMWEASGSVMFEAWASGTPVVATAHAGLPEFVNDDVGVLFDPGTDGQEALNVKGLADAIVEGLSLSQQAGTRTRCRAHAEQYSWTVLGPEIEKTYAAVGGPGIVRTG